MATDYKISNLIEQQFPDFVRDEGPNLVAFLKAYYEWTEQANNVIEVGKNLLNYQDLDSTYDKYFEYFEREIMQDIPKSVLANKTLLAKHIRELYRSRGSEQSFKLLFRILYNEEIDLYYPVDDILRASDGRWVKETSVRVSKPRSGDINTLKGKTVVGASSGATGKVERVIGSFSAGVIIDELYLSSVVGTFVDAERISIQNGDGTVYATITNISGPLREVNIKTLQGGAQHVPGDRVSFTSASGVLANGYVGSTSGDFGAIGWRIIKGGEGYIANSEIVISGGGGTGATFIISGISNTENITVDTDPISSFVNVPINAGPTFVSLGANSAAVSANLAAANVSSQISVALTFSNLIVGTISSVSTTAFGSGYTSLPVANVQFKRVLSKQIPAVIGGGYKGNNAVIIANTIAGSITSVVVDNFGSGYNKTDAVTISNLTRANTENARGDPIVSGVVNYTGKYLDTKGWLSWNNRFQDNYYYQEYSYEVKSDQYIDKFRRSVNNILHPGGTKLFGRTRLYSSVNSAATAAANIVSEVIKYTLGTGTLTIANAAFINAYAALVVNPYSATVIQSLNNGTLKIVYGNNTLFTVEIPTSNTKIMIVDGVGGTANGLYLTNVVSTNTDLTIKTPYAANNLINGTFYYGSVV